MKPNDNNKISEEEKNEYVYERKTYIQDEKIK